MHSRPFFFPASRGKTAAILLALASLTQAHAAVDFYSTGPGQGSPDGLCDVWQQLYGAWGLDPDADEDNDGCPNRIEAIVGSNPFDPTDCSKVGDVITSGNSLVFNFKPQKGKKYQILQADTPLSTTWTLVSGSTKVSTADGPNDTITITKPGGDKKFYKLEVMDHDSDGDGVPDWAEHKTGTNPALASSPGNASGGVANDHDTLRSLLSISAAPIAGYEVGYEVDDKSNGPPAPVAARVGLTRSFGTMPLTVSVTVLGDTPAPTKSSASPSDYNVVGLSGGKITIPASAGTPGNPHAVLVQPVQDALTEVPEHLKVCISPPAGEATAVITEAPLAIADALPGVESNRSLFVAYLGREAGVTTTATGLATALVEGNNDGATINLTFSNLTSAQNTAYLRVENDDLINVGLGQVTGRGWNIRAASVKLTDQAMLNALHAGELYILITTADNPTGEIRGYFNKAVGSTTFTYNPALHDNPALGDPAWQAPTGTALERDIWRFLDQTTYGGTQEIYNEVLAAVNTSISGGGTYLDGYEAWLDAQMALPNPSLMQLVIAADNEEFVLRGNKPIWTGNDPNFSGESYAVTRDGFGGIASISSTANGTFNNNHPFHNNRRREMWTLAMNARAQVRQRMAQALSEILVISELDQTVQSRHYGAANYWDMLANNAFGKFRTILENVTYSPMMGIYLSHIRNRAEYVSGGVNIFPDENYAREIMQLFSIGLILRHPDGSLILDSNGLPIPTYDNDDIAELARVMTGICHGARHRNNITIQRFNGLTFGGSTPRVGPEIEIQVPEGSAAGTSFTNFNEGGGEGWYQAPWIYPMVVLGRTNTITSSNRPWHDFGAKTLLAGKVGQTILAGITDAQLNALSPTASRTRAAQELSAAHNMLAGDPAAGTYNGHPNTPVNISRWLIQRFTTSNPSAGYLYRVSEVYRQTNGDLGEVLKAILLDFEARSLQLADSSISHGRKKEPLIHFTSIMRGSRARSGLPITALRDVQHSFSDTDAQTLNGWPGYSKTLTQTEVDKYVPNATRFRFGDSTTALGQSPLRAPSVFNWFLPDYVVPGAMAEAGLFAPEMQIASETNLVNRVNRLWSYTWMQLQGMDLQPGRDDGVEDMTHVSNNAAVQVKVATGASVPTGAASYLNSVSLTFTPANWNTTQNIHIAAVDDSRREGTHTSTLSHSAASTDPNYNNPPLPSLAVTINDNEGTVGSVIVEETNGITIVGEHATPSTFQDTYTVRLSSAPTSAVTITASANARLNLSPATLTFTNANWSAPQTVTVQAVDNTFRQRTQPGFIAHAVTSSDPAYGGIRAPEVFVFVGDNETEGGNGITVTHSSTNTIVTEGGGTDTFVVALNRAPSGGNTTVNIGTNARVTSSPTSLTFTTLNWYVPQPVTITAVNDAIVNGSSTFNLSLTSSGGTYSSTANAAITVHDNDGAPPGSIVITETSGSTAVTEHSTNPLTVANLDTYSIRLSSAPTQNVTVTVFPQRHVAPMSNHALLMGYYAGHHPSSTSNMQKDRILFDYAPEITNYQSVFQASGGLTSDNAANINAHLAAVLATVDRFDLMWCGGQLKAQTPALTVADLNNTAIVNPRKSIVAALLYGYNTSRGSTSPSFPTEIRDRVRVAAYLVSICPQSFTLK